MTGYDAEKSCPRMYKQTDTPAQVQGRRAAKNLPSLDCKTVVF